MIKKFISYLYKRFINPDITAVVRDQLKLVIQPMSEEAFNALSENKRADFLKACFDLNSNQVLQQILDGQMILQRDRTFSDGETGEHFLHGKIHFHAYGLIKEILQKYANLHELESKKTIVEGREKYEILDTED